jgi:hypothetical protein
MIGMNRRSLLLIGLLLGPAGCTDDPPMCVALTSERVPAPEGNALCADRATCSTTAGEPDHQGCPNTCSCLCHEGRCYQNTCTAIAGCSEPPVYR